MQIEKLINELRKTDLYIETIFMQGGCYKFHLFLKSLFPDAEPMINLERDHVVTYFKGKCYDITGKVDMEGNIYLVVCDIDLVKSWSFAKSSLLQLGECKNCEEPIVI